MPKVVINSLLINYTKQLFLKIFLRKDFFNSKLFTSANRPIHMVGVFIWSVDIKRPNVVSCYLGASAMFIINTSTKNDEPNSRSAQYLLSIKVFFLLFQKMNACYNTIEVHKWFGKQFSLLPLKVKYDFLKKCI